MHERKSEDGEDGIDQSNHYQVPVISIALLQMVLWAVHHGGTDVLVHEEQDGEGEPKEGCKEDSTNC